MLGVLALACAGALAASCTWNYSVDEALGDAGGDDVSIDSSFVDASADTAYVLPDGRVCSGHDEDGDGVPDDCDNCPNVANPDQAGSDIGTACAPASAFIAAPSRLLFDPFRSFGWTTFGSGPGVFQSAPDGDSIAGGTTGVDLPFVVGMTGAGASAVVVTTTVTIVEEASDNAGPGAGVLLRVNGSPTKRFFLCGVSTVSGFAAQRAPDGGCTGGVCAAVTFTYAVDGGTAPAQFTIPADIPHKIGDTIGLRASATASLGDGGILGDFECRVFDPKRPETLKSTDSKYAAKVTAGGARWMPSGEIGLYAQRAKAVFGSVDVLRGP